jgi:hypothetical protein
MSPAYVRSDLDGPLIITMIVPGDMTLSMYAVDGKEGIFVTMVMVSELPTLKAGTLLYVTRADRIPVCIDPHFLRVM